MTDAASRNDREQATEPNEIGRLLVQRLNDGDLDGLVALYEPDAVLALPDGQVAAGSQAIRSAFQQMLAARSRFPPGDQRPALVCGELALTSTRLADGRVTAEVARRQPDGSWRWVLDQPDIQ